MPPKAAAVGSAALLVSRQSARVRSRSPRPEAGDKVFSSFSGSRSPRPGRPSSGSNSSQPTSLRDAGLAEASIPVYGGGMDRKTVTFIGQDLGFKWGDNAVVQSVAPGGQAEQLGVAPGWSLVTIGGDPVKRTDDPAGTRYGRRIMDMLRIKSTYHKQYNLSFLVPQVGPDLEKVEKEETALAHIEDLDAEERSANLQRLEALQECEVDELLQRTKAVHGLLQSGADELTVLFGEKTADEVRECKDVMQNLREGKTYTPEDLEKIDLGYTDNNGDTCLHMACNAESAAPVLEVAAKATPSLLTARNKKHETPLESMLNRVGMGTGRLALLGVFSSIAPIAFCAPFANGTPASLHLQEEEHTFLPSRVVTWEQIQAILEAGVAEKIQRGYTDLLPVVKELRPHVDLTEAESVWSELLFDHVYGVLESPQDDAIRHTRESRKRAESVWLALEVLLRASSDDDVDFEADMLNAQKEPVPHTSLKYVTRGLLAATRGPMEPPFDPREPYRERIVGLVDTLQRRSSDRLGLLLEELQCDDAAAADELLTGIPVNELHGINTRCAEVRGADGRLRLDTTLEEESYDVRPVDTPDWVFNQSLDLATIKQLKEAGALERVRELIDLAGGNLVAALERVRKTVDFSGGAGHDASEERFRFAQIHAAWVWALYGRHLQHVNTALRKVLGLSPDDELAFPCKGIGDVDLCSFRARSEPKGIPRILEKTAEAIEEEAVVGRTPEILALSMKSRAESQSIVDQRALCELLTPACYICDIVGAELSVASIKELVIVYRKLRELRLEKDGFQVVRTKNGFSADAPASAGGYRDLKIWAMVNVEGISIALELQMHIKGFYDLKRLMHMPYECYRGSYDHPHLVDTWQHPPPPVPVAAAASSTNVLAAAASSTDTLAAAASSTDTLGAAAPSTDAPATEKEEDLDVASLPEEGPKKGGCCALFLEVLRPLLQSRPKVAPLDEPTTPAETTESAERSEPAAPTKPADPLESAGE